MTSASTKPEYKHSVIEGTPDPIFKGSIELMVRHPGEKFRPATSRERFDLLTDSYLNPKNNEQDAFAREEAYAGGTTLHYVHPFFIVEDRPQFGRYRTAYDPRGLVAKLSPPNKGVMFSEDKAVRAVDISHDPIYKRDIAVIHDLKGLHEYSAPLIALTGDLEAPEKIAEIIRHMGNNPPTKDRYDNGYETPTDKPTIYLSKEKNIAIPHMGIASSPNATFFHIGSDQLFSLFRPFVFA